LLNQFHAVGKKAVSQREYGSAVTQPRTEVHPRGSRDRLLAAPQREGEARSVLEHQHAIVITPRRPGAKAEIGLIETARAFLVADRVGAA
jgi:hypothetical protein